MKPVIAILAHKDLGRVAQLVKYLSNSGLRTCVHIDSAVSAERFDELKISLNEHADVLFAKRVECEWGRFSLVEAALNLSECSLNAWPDASHVFLVSGDSLPVRSSKELTEFLNENADVDFIESVAAAENNWITGGLGHERFTLTFPFSWKSQRWLFDIWVEAQRKLGLKRRVPYALEPHIGSQWWCLSKATLSSILNDPNKREYDAYFRKCWIPDESYFQTLARKHSRVIESRALLFSKFDHQGKPATFYDDHVDEITGLDSFFVRKIWPGAAGLYKRYLHSKFSELKVENGTSTIFERIQTATDRRKLGRSGLYMHGRAPSQWYKKHSPTAASYNAYTDFTSIFPGFDQWIENNTGVRNHGRIFHDNLVNFADSAKVGPGGISDNAKIRDLAPESFLCNLVWNTKDVGLGFHYEYGDAPLIADFLVKDPNANLLLVQHGWILGLRESGITNVDFLRKKATDLLNREREIMALLANGETVCEYHVWTCGEVLANPLQVLYEIIGSTPNGLVEVPDMTDASEVKEYAQYLKNIGVDIDLTLLESRNVSSQTNTESRPSNEQAV